MNGFARKNNFDMKKQVVSAQWLVPVLILFLAFALRFYHLDAKGLWGDEIAQARWAAFPLEKIWERFRDPPDFLLHFVLGHFALQGGAAALWIRLPSLATSLLAVPATYIATRRLARREIASAAMLLMALAPFQIWYAQDARMYASLVCFAALALYFFLRLLDKPQWRGVLGLTLANAAAIYTHLFGVFPTLIEFFALCGIAGAAGWRARKNGNSLFRWRRIPRSYVLIVTSLALAGSLALPLAPGTLPYVAGQTAGANGTTDAAQAFQLSPQFLQLLLSDSGLAPDMGWRTGLSLALALLGFILLARKNRRGAWILGVWLILPPLLLQLTHPLHDVANRYLIFLQPVYLILIAHGLYAMARGIGGLLRRAAWWRAQNAAARYFVGASAFAALLILFSVAPLRALYARAKLNDWQTLAHFFETHTAPGDVLMVEKGFWGMNTLAFYLKNVNAFSSPPATLKELQKAFAQNRTMWYMSFGGYYNPAEQQWVEQNLQRVEHTQWMRPDLDYAPRDEFHFTQSEPLLEIYMRQGEIPSEIIYGNELGDRARATPHLPLAFAKKLEAKLAVRNPPPRILEIEYASKQPAQFEIDVNGIAFARVQDAAASPNGTTARWVLPPDASAEIVVRLENVSRQTLLFIKAVRVRGE